MGASGVGEMFLCEGRMNSDTYISMLNQTLKPSFEKIFLPNERASIIFQQDNAPCHVSRKSKEWFEKNKIKVLDWPPQSPDLNPIEHLWAKLKISVGKRNPTKKQDLYRVLKEEWEKINKEDCLRLVNSMPKRIHEVIKANGMMTKY